MTTLATAFHEHLRSRATVVLSTRWAKNATTSSKSLVWRAPGRAHGTRSLQTRLQRGQRSRRISPSRNSLQAPRSRWRQRRTEVSKVARVEKPQGHVSRLKRRRSPTTMPAGVKLTSATVAPGMANILLNAVVARTRPPRSRFAVASSETYGSGACASLLSDVDVSRSIDWPRWPPLYQGIPVRGREDQPTETRGVPYFVVNCHFRADRLLSKGARRSS